MTEGNKPRNPSVEEKKALAAYCAKKGPCSEDKERAKGR